MNIEKKPIRKIDDVTVTWASIIEESQDRLVSKFHIDLLYNLKISVDNIMAYVLFLL